MRVIHLRTGPTPDTVIVHFAYDEELRLLVKNVPGRVYDPTKHQWRIPSTPETLEALRATLPAGVALTADDAVKAAHATALVALAGAESVKSAGDSNIVFEYVTQPYAHQRAGLQFLAHLGGGALLWEMGTGKTKTAIDYCEWLARRPEQDLVNAYWIKVLVICPNTVKRNWADEIVKHAVPMNWQQHVLDGTIRNRIADLASARYSIVNCEALSIKAFATALQAREWDVVIVDESTRFKTPGAARTKALHKIRAKHRIILTGTPITGKPEDAWSQLHFVAPGLLGSYWSFRDRYLELDYFKHPVGMKGSTEAELRKLIASRSYRVLKADVLDLPPKVYTKRTVELDGDQAKAYRQMQHDLAVQIAGMEHVTAANILTVLLRLTQITSGMVGAAGKYTWIDKGNAKLAELDDLLNDELRGEQVVIFGQYQRELEELGLRYDAGDSIIYGPTPETVRHEIISQFQAGTRRLLFAQQRTGGIGINLTAAQTAIYYSRSWSLEEWLQSQDRLHRIGQKGTVTILTLLAKGTIDEEIEKALNTKQNLADRLTGDDARRLARVLLER